MSEPAMETLLGKTISATGGGAVTKSDSTVLTGVRGLWVGTSGDLVVTLGGTDLTLKNVQDGTLIPISPTKVKAATSAADIVYFT